MAVLVREPHDLVLDGRAVARALGAQPPHAPHLTPAAHTPSYGVMRFRLANGLRATLRPSRQPAHERLLHGPTLLSTQPP